MRGVGSDSHRVPEEHLARAEVRLVDGAVLPGAALVAPVVVALESVDDLGERGLDVGGREVAARVRDRDGRGVVSVGSVAHVVVDVPEQVRELAVDSARGERARAARDRVRADARGAGRARGL